MGLTVWTIIAVAIVLRNMFEYSKEENEKTMMYIVLFLFVARGVIQFGFNFVRISSQG
ncbi:MAG: hypothetical protein WCL18_07735 [bacterium]